MSDPTLHQFLYDAGWEAAKGPAKKLIEDVEKIDAALVQGTLAKDAAKAELYKVLGAFQPLVLGKCAEGINAAWKEYSGANYQWKKYNIVAAVKIGLGATSLVLSVAGTLSGTVSGVGLVIGAVGAAKSALSLVRDTVMLFRDAESLAFRLQKQLEVMIKKIKDQEKSFFGVGGNEVFSAALERLTGYKKDSLKQLKADAEVLEKKMLKGFVDAQQASKTLPKLLKDAEAADRGLGEAMIAALDATQSMAKLHKVKLALPAKLDPTHPDSGKTIQTIKNALLNAPANNQMKLILEHLGVWGALELAHKNVRQLQLALHGHLEWIADLMKKYNGHKEFVAQVKAFVEQSEGKMGAVAKGLINYAVPFLDLVFVDPTTLTKVDTYSSAAQFLSKVVESGHLQASVVSALEAGNNVVGDVFEREWIKWVSDQGTAGVANTLVIKDIILNAQKVVGKVAKIVK
jgi:hypothetical protein